MYSVSVYPKNRTLVSKNVRTIEHYEKGRTLTTTHFCLEETIYFKPSFQPLLCSKFHWRRLILLLLHSFVFKVYKINQECKKNEKKICTYMYNPEQMQNFRNRKPQIRLKTKL